MKDLSRHIFDNAIPRDVQKKALARKTLYEKEFGKSEQVELHGELNSTLGPFWGVQTLIQGKGLSFDPGKAVIIGVVGPGYAAYRRGMAVASVAAFEGYTPYWLDLGRFSETLGGKVIHKLNSLHALGQRLSEKYKLFRKLYWENYNYHGLKTLNCNSMDQKLSELFAAPIVSLPVDIPFFGAHVWATQAAIHAGLIRVANLLPGNWPQGKHLAQGSLHLVQSPSAYYGYRFLHFMDPRRPVLNPIPPDQIACVGHFIDHEIVSNIPKDCLIRMKRIQAREPLRIFIVLGEDGTSGEILIGILSRIIPKALSGQVNLYLNFGDQYSLWETAKGLFPQLKEAAIFHEGDWPETQKACALALRQQLFGIHVFVHQDLFAAVYTTNLLMRASELMITNPSELAFYPVPKLFIKRAEEQEQWNALRGGELGDGTLEFEHPGQALQVLDLMIREPDLLRMQVENIIKLHSIGGYNGAYGALKSLLERRNVGNG